jgi:transcriptional regulator with XRE-family HTH domain
MRTFDFDAFYRALCATVASRNVTWKRVSDETGVSPTTLSRMSKGRQPDSESLTSLSAWSGLNPVEFYQGQKRNPESMALVGKLLREDPNLDDSGAEALEAILKAAYEQFKRRTG